MLETELGHIEAVKKMMADNTDIDLLEIPWIVADRGAHLDAYKDGLTPREEIIEQISACQ